MKLEKIDKNTEINPLAEERKVGIENSDTNKAALLIHGFGGKSENWLYTAEELYRKTGIPSYIPRLPGHGTNSIDFRNSSAEQWLRRAFDSYLYLKNLYDEIYIAGLSMGGLIASIIAAEFDTKKLNLTAPAFFTKDKTIILTPILKYFVKRIVNNSEIDAEDISEERLSFRENYAKYYYTEQLSELYKLILKARKKVDKISAPTQLILTEKDEQVDSYKIKRFLKGKMGQTLSDIKIYQDSTHVITNSTEKERCADDIINFFKADF